MKKKVNFHFAFLLVLFLKLALAQNISVNYYSSIDDIYASFEVGDLTYEQYTDLASLFESKVDINNDNLQRLLIIPGVNSNDIAPLKKKRDEGVIFKNLRQVANVFPNDIELISPFIDIIPKRDQGMNGNFRIYKRCDFEAPALSNDPYHSGRMELRWSDFSMDYRFKQQADLELQTTYRNVRYNTNDVEIVLGNYDAHLGYGLLVGRKISHSTLERSNSARSYLASPFYGDLNGLFASLYLHRKWKLKLAISANKYGKTSQSMAGIAASWNNSQKEQKGIVIYFGKFSSADMDSEKIEQYGLSIFGINNFFKNKLQYELAVLNNGSWGGNLILTPSKKTCNIAWKFWVYHPDFIVLYSDGFCDRGYEKYYPRGNEFYLKAYQAGELGTDINLKIKPIRKLSINCVTSFFSMPNSLSNGGEIYLSGIYKFNNNDNLRLSYTRNWEGLGISGDTKDKVYIAHQWEIGNSIYIRENFYYKWNNYTESNKKEQYWVKSELIYAFYNWLSFSLRLDRNDSNVDDNSIGYWKLTLSPIISDRFSNVKTSISLKKTDSMSEVSINAKVNLRISW